MYFLYALYFLPNLFFVLLSWIFSPLLAAISVVFGISKLPGFLQWFSTTDDDLDGGIHQKVSGYEEGLTGFKLWWQRTCWICRNPSNGWQSFVFGKSVKGFKILESQVSENPKKQWYLMTNEDGKEFFCSKKDQPLFGKYYLKLWIGWNNKSYDGFNHQYVFQCGFKSKD